MEIKFTDGTELSLPSNRKHAARYMADMIRNRGELPANQISSQSFVIPTQGTVINGIIPTQQDRVFNYIPSTSYTIKSFKPISVKGPRY